MQPATTFAELEAQCETLSSSGIIPINQAGASVWPPTVLPLLYATTTAPDGWAADVLAKEAKINDPDSPQLAGLEAWSSLKDSGCFNEDYTTSTFEDSVQRVYSGEAAYDMIHSNIASVYLDAAGGDAAALDAAVGFTALGGTSKATGVSFGPIGSFVVPKNEDSAKQEAALEFIRFVTGDGLRPVHPGLRHVPDHRGRAGAGEPLRAAEVLQGSCRRGSGPPDDRAEPAVRPDREQRIAVLPQFAVGQLTAQEVVDKMQQEFESAARAQGVEGF